MVSNECDRMYGVGWLDGYACNFGKFYNARFKQDNALHAVLHRSGGKGDANNNDSRLNSPRSNIKWRSIFCFSERQ